MSRQTSGGLEVKTLPDGTSAFELRFRARGRRESVTLHGRDACECGCGGGWDDRSARTELGNILARVRAGVWEPRAVVARPTAPAQAPTFHESASSWLTAKVHGVLGDKPIDENTRTNYRWRLTRH